MKSRCRLRGSCGAMLTVLSIAIASVSPPAVAQTPPPNTAPPTSSPPPFWARPRPTATECRCDDPASAPGTAAPTRGMSPGVVLTLAVGGIVLLLLVWRWQRGAAAVRVPRSPTPPPLRAASISTTAQARPALSRSDDLDSQALTQRIELNEPLPEPGTEEARVFFREAAASLSAALKKSPQRQDLRYKLLEMYFSAGMGHEFVNEAHIFLEQNRGLHDESWSEIVRMGHELVPEHTLFRQPDGAAIQRKVQFRRFYDRKLDQAALHAAQQQLATAAAPLLRGKSFMAEMRAELAGGGTRPPPPVTQARELEALAEGARIFLKRDRRRPHDDAMLNAFGQVLLARELKKKSVVTATHDGTHALATATAASRLGLQCVVYITESDLALQYARVLTLRKLGAMVRPVRLDGGARFSDPRQHALQSWAEKPEDSLYISTLAGGPSPYPMLVGELLATIGREAADQLQQAAGSPPAAVVVNAADGYSGMGLLRAFIGSPEINLYCVDDLPAEEQADPNTTPLTLLRMRREHAWLRATGRVTYENGDSEDVLRVVERFHVGGVSLTHGAGRSLAHACKVARALSAKECVLVLVPNQGEAEPAGGYRDL